MRCLCLADALARNGADVLFLCRQLPGSLNDFIERQGFPVERLQSAAAHRAQPERGPDGGPSWLEVPWIKDCEQSLPALERFDANWLIVDHYGIGAEWEGALRRPGRRLLAVDDLADRPTTATCCSIRITSAAIWRKGMPGSFPCIAERCWGLDMPYCNASTRRCAGRCRPAAQNRGESWCSSAVPMRPTRLARRCERWRRRNSPTWLWMWSSAPIIPIRRRSPRSPARVPAPTLHRGLRSLAGLMFRADLP